MESRLLEQPEKLLRFGDWDFQLLLSLLAGLAFSGERAFVVALVCYIPLILFLVGLNGYRPYGMPSQD